MFQQLAHLHLLETAERAKAKEVALCLMPFAFIIIYTQAEGGAAEIRLRASQYSLVAHTIDDHEGSLGQALSSVGHDKEAPTLWIVEACAVLRASFAFSGCTLSFPLCMHPYALTS